MPEIIVVDDDPLVGQLSHDLLSEAGYDVRLIRDSTTAMDAIRQDRPRFVLLDILMPGVDGLTLLHQIKNDLILRETRVGVVSGKSFSPEKDRALRYGAEIFIEKPYDVKNFSKQIRGLIGSPNDPESSRGKSPAETAQLSEKALTFKLRAFGSPAALVLQTGGLVFFLDAGPGSAAAGAALLDEGIREAWLLLSSHHPESISELGAFPPLRCEGFSLRVAGPREPDKSLADLLRQAISASFTQNPEPIRSRLTLHELREDTYQIESGLKLSPFYANHPGTVLGFAIDSAARRVVYSPLAEIYGEEATALQDYDEKIGRIVRGAELLIHGTRFNDRDYPPRRNQGHSSVSNAAGFAADNEVGRFVLCGFDPSYGPDQITEMEARAASVLDDKGAMISCLAARQGLKVEF